MKSKLLINILMIFGAFLVITALYFGVFVRQKIDLVRILNRQEKVIALRKSELVESRLALVGVANSRVSDSGFFESFYNDMSNMEKGFKISEDFLAGNEVGLIDEGLLKEGEEVEALIEDIYAKVQENFSLYSKLLEYDIAKDFSSPLADENYEDLLGRVNSTMEGLEQFSNDSYLGQEAQAAMSELSVAKKSLENEDYEELLSKLEIAVLNYNLLKIKAFKKVQEPIRSDEGVGMLVRFTNLIVSYESELADVVQRREEIINSIPAGSGLIGIFNTE